MAMGKGLMQKEGTYASEPQPLSTSTTAGPGGGASTRPLTGQQRQMMELAWQRERAREIAVVGPTSDYLIQRYRVNRFWRLFTWEFMFKRLDDVAGKTILDFGCGEGEVSVLLATFGAQVTGVDISPELIGVAEQRAAFDGVADRTRFIVADVTESGLPENTFDVLFCNCVLHHVVDLSQVLPRLVATLKPGGMAIIAEPIAFSPLLQRFRDMVPIPKDASPIEHQLNKDEVRLIAAAFDRTRMTFFNFLGRLTRLFPNRNKIEHGHPFTKAGIVLLLSVDRLILTLFPFLWRLCGNVVFVGEKPTTSHQRRGSAA